MEGTDRSFDGQVFSAIDRSAHGDKVLRPGLRTESFQCDALHTGHELVLNKLVASSSISLNYVARNDATRTRP